MYAVRGLRGKESLQGLLDRLVSAGLIEKSDGDAGKIVRLLNEHGVTSLPEAAIRFCRHEMGADIVLSGTGEIAHLDANIAACEAGPLPANITVEFRRLFSKLNPFTG
jgi:L-galactose dehydrogenase